MQEASHLRSGSWITSVKNYLPWRRTKQDNDIVTWNCTLCAVNELLGILGPPFLEQHAEPQGTYLGEELKLDFTQMPKCFHWVSRRIPHPYWKEDLIIYLKNLGFI